MSNLDEFRSETRAWLEQNCPVSMRGPASEGASCWGGRKWVFASEEQRLWLKNDLAKVAKDTPVVVFSHSPLQKIYKGWNFWTEDADQVQALLKPFKKVSVIYGHVHQIQYNQIGNISFNSVMATAWPWPYPSTYAQAAQYLPKLTVEMNRADPFFERDATGWQFINMADGRVDAHFNLYNNTARTVAFNSKTGQPEDRGYQDLDKRIPPQTHY